MQLSNGTLGFVHGIRPLPERRRCTCVGNGNCLQFKVSDISFIVSKEISLKGAMLDSDLRIFLILISALKMY